MQLFCPFHSISYVNFPIYFPFLISFSVLLSCYPTTFWYHQVHQEPTHLRSLQHLLCDTFEHLYTTQPLFQCNYFLKFFFITLAFFPNYFFLSSNASIVKCFCTNFAKHSCSWAKIEDFSAFPVYCTHHQAEETETSSMHCFTNTFRRQYFNTIFSQYIRHAKSFLLHNPPNPFLFFPLKRTERKET